MARKEVDGIELEYELLGPEDGHPLSVTPGGRFAKESVGVGELGQALAEKGFRVLLWDRPGCGGSDVSFNGRNESIIHADALIGLGKALGFRKMAITGGSAGSRVSMLAAARAPDFCSHLCMWWISGGPISLAQLAAYYCGESATAANMKGMEAVAAASSWAEQVARNPKNKEIILAQKPEEFIQLMQDWAAAYAYSDKSPVPGMAPSDYAKLTMPVLIFRSGRKDLSHTRRTSEWVHELIPGSALVEPPWVEDEWNVASSTAHEPGRGLFESWPKLAPQITDFIKSHG